MSGPLEGVKVVDLSRLAPGPYASMLLADMGADVLLVEPPPGALPSDTGVRPEQDVADRRRAYNPLGRNKRSIVVDLRTDEGVQLVHELARDADVFLEGFRPGAVAQMGVGYHAISGTNPRIVYASISGYGQTGPYSRLVGHDINYISLGGALSAIGRPGQRLSIPQNTLADIAAGGLMTAFAIMSAIYARDRIGRGQYLDMSMTENVLYLLASQTGGVLAGGPSPLPGAERMTGAEPHYNVYECADGKWFSIGSLEPKFWAALCRAVGREDMVDGEFDASRHAEFEAHLTRFFKQKTRDQWFAELREIEMCVAPVLELGEALQDPHLVARGMTVDVPDPVLGSVQQVGIGPKFSETPGGIRRTAPSPGEHTNDVLHALGYDEEAIGRLRARGAVA